MNKELYNDYLKLQEIVIEDAKNIWFQTYNQINVY